MTLNLSQTFSARADRYARNMGPMVATGDVIYLGTAPMVWEFLRGLNGRLFRVIYRAESGQTGDWIGRQGVHESSQDGTVKGTGHAMASADRLTLSFWTATHGDKVNTGAGKGYRTLRADRVLAIAVNGATFITRAGMENLK